MIHLMTIRSYENIHDILAKLFAILDGVCR